MEQDTGGKIEELKALVKGFPAQPGVYLMRDRDGDIIYIGKAKILVNRVRSYFTGKKEVKTALLVRRIHTVEYIVTKSEFEALLLENTLIKKHKPHFNIDLKDDKSYPFIRITKDPYPRVFRTRKVVEDGSEYFGPYSRIQHMDKLLELVEKLFPLRKCAGPLKKREVPCLYHHIGRCAAPCVGKIDPEGYGKLVDQVRALLQGKTDGLVRDLKEKMTTASQELRFEAAADLRDTIRALEELKDQQQVVDLQPEQRDYIALASTGSKASFAVLQMRDGRLTGRDLYHLDICEEEDEAFLQFLTLYYSTHPRPGDAIYLSRTVDLELLREFLKKDSGRCPELKVPEAGRHLKIVKMAVENAELDLKKRLEGRGNTTGLEDLQKTLGLPTLPRRIEGFDIAQLDGNFPVASLISFKDGLPDRKNYRKFHIKSLEGAIDDFQSIKEVVARRYTRLLNEEAPLPDLIMVDGGKGQVSSAQSVLDALGLTIPLCGLAKKNEEIFLPGKSDPVILPKGSPALRILQGVRDETHRFATGFNQQLRHKKLKLTTLEGVPGIGPRRSVRLLKAYANLEALAAADPLEVAEKASIPLPLAENLKHYLEDRAQRERVVSDMKRIRRS